MDSKKPDLDEKEQTAREELEKLFSEPVTRPEIESFTPEVVDDDEIYAGPAGRNGVPAPPPRETLREAFRRRGLSADQITRKLAVVLNAYEPKWNKLTQTWDHFIPAATYLDAIKLYAQLMGELKPDPRVNYNLTITADFEKIMQAQGSPEEINKKFHNTLTLALTGKKQDQ